MVIVHVIYLKTDHVVFEAINKCSIYSRLTVWLYYEHCTVATVRSHLRD